MNKIAVYILCALTLFLGTGAVAEEIENLQELRSQVEAYLQDQMSNSAEIEVDVGSLDPRLALTRCEVPLLFEKTGQNQSQVRQLVSISCEGIKPWRIFVPAQVHRYGPVVVVNKPLARGTVLQEQDLDVKQMDLFSLHPGAVLDVSEAVGKVAQRPLTAGTVLTRNGLKNQLIIKKGQQVNIVAEKSGLRVQMTGIALENGHQDEVIRVRNKSSYRVVEGQVINEGEVKIYL